MKAFSAMPPQALLLASCLAALRRAWHHPVWRVREVSIAIAASSCLLPAEAEAHIKWFAPYDVTEIPLPISDVLNPQFLLALSGFVLLMSSGFLLDRVVAMSWPGLGRPGKQDTVETLLRAGVGAFFIMLFAIGDVLLTPELRTSAEWTSWLQFGIAASMLSARSCALGGVGILVLYGYGVWSYGLFHLADYPIFLGLAAYMVLTAFSSERLREMRMPIIYATVCTSLMWVAIEKWAYPQWTLPLLAARPYLTLGFPADKFLMLAGFVEFALAFYILTGLGLLRLGIAGLGLIFVAAIVDFGKIDAIGHLPMIVAFAAMFLHGPTPLHHALHNARCSLFAEARKAGMCFVGAIGMFFLAYYGLQHTEYGGTPNSHRLAINLQTSLTPR